MIILTIRTDKPEAELGLYDISKQLRYYHWQAHRELAETIHLRIKELLDQQNLSLESLEAVVLFKGPGSFTGLRIGASVANALAASLRIPIIGTVSENWIEKGIASVVAGKNERIIIPDYGSEPHITLPRK
jgi:tRNA threonylcarbamoyladenosine biosynthesis protein TsaB